MMFLSKIRGSRNPVREPKDALKMGDRHLSLVPELAVDIASLRRGSRITRIDEYGVMEEVKDSIA